MENTKKQGVSDTLENIIAQKYKLSGKKLKIVLREVVLAPQNRKIEVGENQKISAEDLRTTLAHTLEFPTQQIQNIDRVVEQADSIENLNSGTNSVEEFFSWLNQTLTILKHLNDGFVSESDASERQNFLSMADRRENELMLCLGLYESSSAALAHERAKFIRYKLQKLREMRTSILFLTKEGTDIETTRSEFDAAKPYYQYFKNLQNLPFGYDAPASKKQELGLNFDEEEYTEGYYYTNLQNRLLDEMAQNDLMETDYQQNSDKLQEFTGR